MAGANREIFFTLLAAHLVGASGQVVAFEPQPRLFDLLRKSIAINGFNSTVDLECIASPQLQGRPRCPGMAITRLRLARNNKPQDGIEVACDVPAVLQRVAARRGKRIVPSFIKVDVEGYEYFVWKGALTGSGTFRR